MQKSHPLLSSDFTKLQSSVDQIRRSLIAHAEIKGGHFASALGVIELTVALHACFRFPHDQLIWDTGHQAYAHRWLSGQAKQLSSMRDWGGLHPFPSPEESLFSPAVVGHAGNALAWGIGLASAHHRLLSHRKTVVVTGDGSFESGLTLEAANQWMQLDPALDLLWILNLNGYSISKIKNTSWFLELIQASPSVNVVEEGHQLESLYAALKSLAAQSGPRILMVKTEKGYGVPEALKAPVRYHTYPKALPEKRERTYPEWVGAWSLTCAQASPPMLFITPAMVEGSQLKATQAQHPNQVWDVGIAESYGVTLAAGAASGGLKPVVICYATFLQRAFDSILHDLAIARLPVTLLIDRAGVVGGDGETHQGLYDLSWLSTIPHLQIWTPSSHLSLNSMLAQVAKGVKGLTCLRYPNRSAALSSWTDAFHLTAHAFYTEHAFDLWLEGGLYQPIERGGDSDLLLINFGALLPAALEAASHYGAAVLDVPLAWPLPTSEIFAVGQKFKRWITLEEGVASGGIGEKLRLAFPSQSLLHLGFPKTFLKHGDPAVQISAHQMDGPGIVAQIKRWIQSEASEAGTI